MKSFFKIIISCFVLVCLLFPKESLAQRGFRLGFNLTPTISRASFIDTFPEHFDRKYHPGINAGLGLHYGINNGISLYTGLLYSSKGYKIVNDTNTLRPEIKGNVLAIEVPIGFYLRQPISKTVFLRELVGISVCYNTNQEKSFIRFPEDNPFALEAVLNKRINYLVNIGVDFEYEMEAGHYLSFGIIYRHGFGLPMTLNIINNPDVTDRTPSFDMGYAGGYLGLNMSIMFNLKSLKPQKGELFFD